MNSPPRPPTVTHTRGHTPEFQQLIREKSENFVGREFVFDAINEFLHRCNRGYFTIIGTPGSGKSAILAQYATKHPNVIYYNTQFEGKNQADHFLTSICNQLIGIGNWESEVPDKATEGSWFLSLLLQQISDQLEPHQPLIIAIDGLDAVDRNSQSPSANLLYLPRYLPEKVYFLLTRRPFIRDKSGLLIEAPSQILTLEDYPEQNQEDVQTYIRQCLTPLSKGGTGKESSSGQGGTEQESSSGQGKMGEETRDRTSPPLTRGDGGDLNSWLITHYLTEQEFITQLTAYSENNFMVLSQTLNAIAQGFYDESFQLDKIPPALEEYYHNHWQYMKGQSLSALELGVLNQLVTPQTCLNPLNLYGLSAQAIAQILNEDEYDVEEVLENWIEFLQQQQREGEIHYSLYHSSFRNWLTGHWQI